MALSIWGRKRSVQLIWEEFLKLLKEDAGSQVVETWFKAVSLDSWDEAKHLVILQFPNQFVGNWIQEHYLGLAKTHLCRLLNVDSITFSFTYKNVIEPTRNIIPASVIHNDQDNYALVPQAPAGVTVTTANKQQSRPKRTAGNLIQEYQFDSFIVGPSNSLAHAAAYAVSKGLGKVYNPMFIYGGTGLGKTHLMHATGNEAKKKNPKAIVRYETADRFMHEFILSIRNDRYHQFRDKYQKVDLLLLDDVQFLSNKEQTQETFFHIFNTLHQKQKQIILSSDTFPKEIVGLQSRLKSRMEWGLVVDIQTPDLETKMAILKRKSESQGISLDDEVVNFIASRVLSNVRELEGALVRVGAFASLTNQKITIELAKRVLLHLTEKKPDSVMLETILKSVAKHYSVSIQDLRSKTRQKSVATARQTAFYVMKKHSISSLQAIGNYVGGRDHSTVIHAIGKVEIRLENDTTVGQKIKAIEQDIQTS